MILRRQLSFFLAFAVWLSVAGRIAWADEKTPPGTSPEHNFLRLTVDKSGKKTALQTAITRFVPADRKHPGVTVDLVAAVHVGDKSYYEALNKRLADYDIVLYELVAPPGTRIERGHQAASNHPVGALQNALKDLLKLDHQLEDIDYTKRNMVHADMSPDEFAKSMDERGESFWTMFFRLMAEGMLRDAKNQAASTSSDADLLLALFDKDRAVALKRLMAVQFEDMQGGLLSGAEGSTLITERNKVALAEMDKQMAAGKKHIAIFYGGGHMSDMEKRLVADHGFRRGNESWLTAWDLRDPSDRHRAAK